MKQIDFIPIKNLIPTISESYNNKLVFKVPSYQRGYRWNSKDVLYLLDDIYQLYSKPGRRKEEIYCLQPIVVKFFEETDSLSNHFSERQKTVYELIDGQQRLTTIYLILSYLDIEPFELTYDTRNNSKEFLRTVFKNKNYPEELREANVDYWHICNTWDEINKWFGNPKNEDSYNFRDFLLNNVKLIWYCVEEDKDSREIYERLNVGKIPLTNAELVKALILSNNSDHLKHKVSVQWDQIESRLQDDKLWHMLTGPEEPVYYLETRIDLLLDIVAGKNDKVLHDEKERYFTFQRFNALKDACTTTNEEDTKFWVSQEINSIDSAWKEVLNKFQILNDWFEDAKIYHYIGYLRTFPIQPEAGSLRKLLLLYSGKRKSVFIDDVKELIFKNITNGSYNSWKVILTEYRSAASNKQNILIQLKQSIGNFLDTLTYNASDLDRIRKVLLLFNLTTLINHQKVLEDKYGKNTLQSKNNIFPFDLFKKERNWDVEHVHSQTDMKIVKKDEQTQWVVNALLDSEKDQMELIKSEFGINKEIDLLKGDELKAIVDAVIQPLLPERFEQIRSKLSSELEKSIQTKDSLYNLTFLDAGTNRSYQNALFPTKRRFLLEKDKTGQFVPVCTKNLFQKYYTSKSARISSWTEEDALGYRESMIEMFANSLIQD